jgi:hypothetical protein
LRSARPRYGPGCATFYAVEPQGYVCGDGPRVTLDANDAIYRALAPYATKADTPWPHSYAESLGLMRYFTTPTTELQKLREADFRAHTRDVEQARAGTVAAGLQGVDVTLPDNGPPEIPPLPITVFEDRKELGRRSTVAYSAEARIGERAFLLTGDFAWIPKDRVRPYPHVGFHGVKLGVDAQLPLAFFRRDARPKYRRDSAGAFVAEGTTFARLAHVELTGQREQVGGETYLETKEPGVFVQRRDAVLPEPAAKTPWGGALNGEDTAGGGKGRATWIEVSIEGGWLLAYEGTRPVYATLISPGKGGIAKAGEDPLERAASPIGRYPISGKFVTSTMEAPGELIHSEVPFARTSSALTHSTAPTGTTTGDNSKAAAASTWRRSTPSGCSTSPTPSCRRAGTVCAGYPSRGQRRLSSCTARSAAAVRERAQGQAKINRCRALR